MTVGDFLEKFKDVDLNSKLIFVIKINDKSEEISNVAIDVNEISCDYVELEIKDWTTYQYLF